MMGWGFRWEGVSGWGTHVLPWLIHVNVWQKPSQYCKVTSLQLKKKKKDLGKRARSEVLRSNLGEFLNVICNTHSLFCNQSPGTYYMSIFFSFCAVETQAKLLEASVGEESEHIRGAQRTYQSRSFL